MNHEEHRAHEGFSRPAERVSHNAAVPPWKTPRARVRKRALRMEIGREAIKRRYVTAAEEWVLVAVPYGPSRSEEWEIVPW